MIDKTTTRQSSSPDAPSNGSAWAGLLAAGIGATAFGLLTDASESSARVSRGLQWYRPAGALSGVAICAIIIWIAAWALLHVLWKGKHLARQRMLMEATLILALVALITTFPPFYELFGD